MELNILELTGDGYLRLSGADDRILAANAGAARLLDWEAGAPDLVGRKLADVRTAPLAEHGRGLLAQHGELHNFLCFWTTHKQRAKKVLVDARLHDDPAAGRVIDVVVKDVSALTLHEQILDTEHQRFLVMLQSIGEGVLATDLEGRTLWMNPAAERLMGWSLAEAQGRPVTEIFHVVDAKTRQPMPDPVPVILQRDARVRSSGWMMLLTRDGRELPVASSGSPLRDAAGAERGVVLVFRDDSERREAHRALRESVQVFRAIFMRAGIGMMLTDLRGMMLDTNQALRDMLGYSASELYGRPLTAVTHPEDGGGEMTALHAAFAEGQRDHRLQAVKRYIRKDATVLWGRVTTTLIFDDEGHPLFGIGMIEDITQQRLADEALEAEKERLLVTLRSIGEGVIATDAAGRVHLVNRAAEKLTGWAQHEAQGRPLDEVFTLLDTETQEPLGADVLGSLIRTGAFAAFPEDTVLRTREGSIRQIAESATPIRDREGRILGIVIVFRDTTQDRRREEEVIRGQKLESLGVLAGGIAHDFNNILTAILGNIALARLSPASQDVELAEMLGEAETAALRAKDLTQQLLTFARGGAPLKQATALAPLLRDAVQFALRGANCAGDLALEENLWPAEVDPAQLTQVVNNLVLNAVQAMPRGGTVTVRAGNITLDLRQEIPLKPGRYVQVSIGDHGRGIPEKDLSRIFDPYFTTKVKGSGMGLTTAYSIIRKHGGYVGVASQVGVGTTFTLYLPAAGAPPTAALATGSPAHQVVPGEHRILVMDDEAPIRRMAQRLLEIAGYQVTTAADGAEAVRLYQAAHDQGAPFTAAILDITIPGGMGGRETLLHLKKLNPAIKAIVSSGYSTDAIMAAPGDFGFVGLVGKPYRPAELLAELSRVLAL
jgi:PAS domain S-box-containing protein